MIRGIGLDKDMRTTTQYTAESTQDKMKIQIATLCDKLAVENKKAIGRIMTSSEIASIMSLSDSITRAKAELEKLQAIQGKEYNCEEWDNRNNNSAMASLMAEEVMSGKAHFSGSGFEATQNGGSTIMVKR